MAEKKKLTPLMKEYEEETGKNARWGGKLTKAYKKWRRKRQKKEKPEAKPEKKPEELGKWFKSLQKGGKLIPAEEEGPPETIPKGEVSETEVSTIPREIPKPKPTETLVSGERVEIIDTEGKGQPLYKVKLPELSGQEKELVGKVKNQAIDEIEVDPTAIADPEERREIFTREVKKMVKKRSRDMKVSSGRLDQLTEIIVRDMIGFGPLDYLLADDSLEDILVTGMGQPVYIYHRDYGMCRTNISFDSEEVLTHYIEKMGRMVGRRIDQQTPLLDARLPDGSRVNATIPPVSLEGPTLSIRKFRKDPLTIVDIINYGTLTTDVAAFLWFIVDGLGVKPANILFAGGTACGKSTTLNAATAFVPNRDRIISIEDTAELQLPHEHWVRLETRPPNVEGRGEIVMEDLVKNALRMRPDRIIVGEVRGPEAMTMFTGMNTGHDGCMGTVHSNSAMETVTRLTEPPMNVPKIMIQALDAVVMQQRLHHRGKGLVRRITEIAEVTGFEEDKPQLSRIYKWDARKDSLEPTGVPSQIKKTIADFTGISGEEVEIEIEKRAAIIEWLREQEIRDIFEVGRFIQEYYRNPEGLLERV